MKIKEIIKKLEHLTDKGEKETLSNNELKDIEILSSIITTFECLTVPIGEKEEVYSDIIFELFYNNIIELTKNSKNGTNKEKKEKS